jgi:eukaryotic-like serine/threonine-protein kinase
MNVGRYRIVEELGRGAMGIVYKAHDPNLDLVVALKVLRQDRVVTESFTRRFVAEARALGRLDHPNIVRVYNVDEDRGTVFIAMEFIEGESLDGLMRKRRFSPEEIAGLGAEIASALDDAHRRGIVHRDIKPSNILVRSDGKPKITDFGIARIEDPSAQTMTQAGEILGTPAYMSPEQVMSRPVDGRSDLFSLGIILYELCAGKRPFGGESLGAVFNAITGKEPPPLGEAHPDVPADLDRIVAKCLRKDPDERYGTGADLAAALRDSLRKVREPALAAPPAPGPKPKSKAVALAAAAALLAVVFGLGYRSLAPGTAPVPDSVKPGMAVLKVDSAPSGARLFVDGGFRGQTPASLEIPLGKHEVRLTMPDHNDWEAQIELEDPGETPLLVRLVPIARSAPSEAEPSAGVR